MRFLQAVISKFKYRTILVETRKGGLNVLSCAVPFESLFVFVVLHDKTGKLEY